MFVHLGSLHDVQHQSLIIGSPGVEVFTVESSVPDGLARVGRGDDPFGTLTKEACEGLDTSVTCSITEARVTLTGDAPASKRLPLTETSILRYATAVLSARILSEDPQRPDR